MSTPTIRAALERLVELSKKHAVASVWDGAFFNARAALEAEPVGEEPSAADLLPVEPPNIQTTMALQYRSAWREGVEDGWNEARAVLDRWARPTAPPAPAAPAAPEPGEVGELVAWLTMLRNDSRGVATRYDDRLARIATLLEQSPAPAPAVAAVPVAERPWERTGWCDEQGRCGR